MPTVAEAISVLTARYPASARPLSWALGDLARVAAAQRQDTGPPALLPLDQALAPDLVELYLQQAAAGQLRARGTHPESQRSLATRAWAVRAASRLVGSDVTIHSPAAPLQHISHRSILSLLRRAARASDADPASAALCRAALAAHLVAAGALSAPQVASLPVPRAGRVRWRHPAVPASSADDPFANVQLGTAGHGLLDRWLAHRARLLSGRGGATRLIVSLSAHAGPHGAVPPGLPVQGQAVARAHAWLVERTGTPVPADLRTLTWSVRRHGAPIRP